MQYRIIVLGVIFSMAFGGIYLAFAADPSPTTMKFQIPIPGFGDAKGNVELCTGSGNTLECNGIAQYVAAVYSWLIGAAAILAVLMLMIAGVKWLTAGGSNRTGEAKTAISNALVGLGLVLGAVLLLNLINPQLTIFNPLQVQQIGSISLPPLTDEQVTDPTLTPNAASSAEAGHGNVPFFSQGDPRWSYLARSGCGITSFAMVAKSYGKDVDPAKAYATNGNSTSGNYPGLASKYGLKFSWIENKSFSTVDQLIKNGKPIMMYTVNPYFTGRYHFVVITGFNGSAYTINDPNGGRRTTATLEQITGPVRSSGEGWSYPTYAYMHP